MRRTRQDIQLSQTIKHIVNLESRERERERMLSLSSSVSPVTRFRQIRKNIDLAYFDVPEM